jgi:RNA polymerase sigma-70 factor (ECF subfamily)
MVHPPCKKWVQKLSVRIDDLSSAEQIELEEHLQSCLACSQAYNDWKQMVDLLHTLPAPKFPVGLPPRLLAEMDASLTVQRSETTNILEGDVSLKQQGLFFFQKVHEEYRKPLGTFLRRLLAQENEVEDLYGKVWVKFWNYLQDIQAFPTLEEARQWLFKVARHQVIDKYRKEGKLFSNPIDIVEYNPTLMGEWSSEQEYFERLRQMSPIHRLCVILQEVYKYPQQEIATDLDIPKETVSINVLHGRKHLFPLLDGHFPDMTFPT